MSAIVSEPRLTSALDTLRSFLSAASASSSPPTASPLLLWNTLTALAEACVTIIDTSCNSINAESVSLDRSRLFQLETKLGEVAERTVMLEVLLKKMFDDIAILHKVDDDRKLMLSSIEALNTLETRFEHLLRGVERHAEFTNELNDRLTNTVGAHNAEIEQLTIAVRGLREQSLHKEGHTLSSTAVHAEGSRRSGLTVKEWKGEGILVTDVLQGSPAAAAGLVAGDIIAGVGTDSCKTLDQFRRLFHFGHKPVHLLVVRGKEVLDVNISVQS